MSFHTESEFHKTWASLHPNLNRFSVLRQYRVPLNGKSVLITGQGSTNRLNIRPKDLLTFRLNGPSWTLSKVVIRDLDSYLRRIWRIMAVTSSRLQLIPREKIQWYWKTKELKLLDVMSQRIRILKFYLVERGWKFIINRLDMRIPVKDEDIDKLIEEVEDHLGRIWNLGSDWLKWTSNHIILKILWRK